ncbi:MAG: GAF domain-containing protein [Anaerolineae bacterium]|nr:GAF domain-containing protein [Anaerolineae bacterium]
MQAEFSVNHLQFLNDVMQTVSGIPTLDALFARVVTLLKERFDYAHVQVFRLDPQMGAMRLVAGYGELGKKMLAAGHHLPLAHGVVGTAAATGRAVLAADVTQDSNWVPSPDLPETRGELAVPITLNGRVVGVLDVQSNEPGTLSSTDQLLLEAISPIFEITRLLNQAEMFRQLSEVPAAGSLQGIAIATLRDMRLIYVNETAFNTLGIEEGQQMMGAPLITLYAEQDRAAFERDVLSAVLAGGEWRGEFTITTRDGQTIPTYHTVFLVRDEQGKPNHVAVQFSDIATRKESETRLSEERNLLRTLIDLIPDSIFVKDRESRIVVNNRTHAVDVLGASSPDEAVGKTDFDYFEEALARQYFEDEQQMMDSGVALIDHEHPVVMPDGHTIWHSNTKVPLQDVNGNVTGLVGIARDITELKMRQEERDHAFEAAQRQRALAETLADISMRLASQADYQDVLDQILGLALQNSPATQECSIALIRGNALFLEKTRSSVEASTSAEWEQQVIPLEQMPLTQQMMKHQQPVIVNAVTEEARAGLKTSGLGWVESFMIVPIVLRDNMLGLIWLSSTIPDTYDENDLQTLQPLANAAAIALENARLLQNSETRANHQQRLNEISVKFQETNSIDELLAVAMKELGPALKAKIGRVRLSIPEDAPVIIPGGTPQDNGHSGTTAAEDL